MFGTSRDSEMSGANPAKRLLVMPANNTCWLVFWLAGRYGNVGHLYSPSRRTKPNPTLPYLLDNGAYSAFSSGKPWDADAFIAHVEYYAFKALRPMGIVVPDVVANAAATFELWNHWAPILRDKYHLKLYLAVQDGMAPANVKALEVQPDAIFVGGSTAWKWETVPSWCRYFETVHVGRVNSLEKLLFCQFNGVSSCDGSGWFRGRVAQIYQLGEFLMRQAGFDELSELNRIIYHSRLSHDTQDCLPLEAA